MYLIVTSIKWDKFTILQLFIVIIIFKNVITCILTDMSPTSAAALTLGTTSDLYSEKALMPTFNDLDHMFESDSESSDADAVSCTL